MNLDDRYRSAATRLYASETTRLSVPVHATVHRMPCGGAFVEMQAWVPAEEIGWTHEKPEVVCSKPAQR